MDGARHELICPTKALRRRQKAAAPYARRLDRMAAMLSRLGGRGYQVREEQEAYGADFDPDPDSDFDLAEQD